MAIHHWTLTDASSLQLNKMLNFPLRLLLSLTGESSSVAAAGAVEHSQSESRRDGSCIQGNPPGHLRTIFTQEKFLKGPIKKQERKKENINSIYCPLFVASGNNLMLIPSFLLLYVPDLERDKKNKAVLKATEKHRLNSVNCIF